MFWMSLDARRRSSGGSEIGHGIGLRSSSCCRSLRMFCLAVEKRTPFWRLNCGTLLDHSVVLNMRNLPCHTVFTRVSYGHNTTITLQTSIHSMESFEAKTHRNQAVELHALGVCAGQFGALRNEF